MKDCRLCPRECRADRDSGELGFCGVDSNIKIARAAPHMWEEPVISGTRGSGAIFFSGCSLRCVFCQNKKISHGATGKIVDCDELERIIFELRDGGVHNINLVTATHYADRVASVLERVKPKLDIPIVWNSSGYEIPETLDMLDGLIDIYLPDFKYFDRSLAENYSSAPDYPEIAAKAIEKMYSQVGAVSLDQNGLLMRGMIVRHLVLPGCRKDSIKVIERLSELLPPNDIYLSLMNQYTPDFALDSPFANLHRRLTSFEYQSVMRRANELGFVGFSQDRAAATADFTPEFFGE